MINAREQVKDALKTVCTNVKMSRPEGDVVLPLIVYAEMQNLPVNMAYVRLGWRVAIYCNTFSELVDLVAQVDDVMSNTLGYTRTGKTPDDQARVGTDLYLCRLDYRGLVDTKINGVIKHST